MYLLNRHLVTGVTLGALGLSAFAAFAFADEMGRPDGVDPSSLVRYEGRDYDVAYEDWIDTDPQAISIVKKIEGGRVSYVTITTTASGTYSTDAMFSKTVRYPGITVGEQRRDDRFSYWSNGHWTSFSTRIGDSFTYYSASKR